MRRYLVLILGALILTACLTLAGNVAYPTPGVNVVAIQTDVAATAYVRFTETVTVTSIPTVRPTATFPPTATRIPEPTLIPTIDPERIPDLLNSSLSIQPLDAFKGHNLQRITGWSNGFNGGMWDRGSGDKNQGYLWLDTSHLLLFPTIGETQQPNWETIYARPVVMNISTGAVWLPPNDRPMKDSRWFNIVLPRWSQKLKLLVTAENIGKNEGVSTFTVDGKRIAHYEGLLVDVSPSAERVFIGGNTWVDLGNGKKVDFGWGPGFGYEVGRWFPIWSRDENQVYFCCYYYGNAKTGQSYTITDENTIFDGGPFINLHSLRHAYGVWLNNHIVMAKYGAWWYEGPDFSTIFDVSERTYHNLGIIAGLPDEFNNNTYSYKSISPNGDYMYVSPGAQSETDPQIYLVDLKTLKSKLYHVSGLDWSANGKYALTGSQVLTLSDKTLRILPTKPESPKPLYAIARAWHPTKGVLVWIYADKQQHMVVNLLDVETLTYQESKFALATNFNGTYYTNGMSIIWNPMGNFFAFEAADGSLWQLDYPNLKNLKQLTLPMANVKDIAWSPDGNSLSFIGGADIYIVDTRK